MAGACLTVGCEPVRHYNRLSVAQFGSKLPKKPYGTVKAFTSAKEVPQPFEVIGFLSCEGSPAEDAGIVNAMLYRAADMGGDGVILNTGSAGVTEPGAQKIDVRVGGPGFFGFGNQSVYRSQVIRFK